MDKIVSISFAESSRKNHKVANPLVWSDGRVFESSEGATSESYSGAHLCYFQSELLRKIQPIK